MFQLQDTPQYGKALFATLDLSPGTIVIREKPLVVVKDIAAGEGPCPAITSHVPEWCCAVLASFSSSPPTIQHYYLDLFFPDEAEYPHHPMVTTTRQLAAALVDLVLSCGRPSPERDVLLSSGDPEQLVTQLLLTWQVNNHSIPGGSAIFRLGCRLNHSCGDANTTFSFQEGCGTHVVVRPVQAGEMLTTNYLGSIFSLMATPVRQQYLFRTKLFHCGCHRCTIEVDHFRALPCPRCKPHSRFCQSGVRTIQGETAGRTIQGEIAGSGPAGANQPAQPQRGQPQVSHSSPQTGKPLVVKHDRAEVSVGRKHSLPDSVGWTGLHRLSASSEATCSPDPQGSSQTIPLAGPRYVTTSGPSAVLPEQKLWGSTLLDLLVPIFPDGPCRGSLMHCLHQGSLLCDMKRIRTQHPCPWSCDKCGYECDLVGQGVRGEALPHDGCADPLGPLLMEAEALLGQQVLAFGDLVDEDEDGGDCGGLLARGRSLLRECWDVVGVRHWTGFFVMYKMVELLCLMLAGAVSVDLCRSRTIVGGTARPQDVCDEPSSLALEALPVVSPWGGRTCSDEGCGTRWDLLT